MDTTRHPLQKVARGLPHLQVILVVYDALEEDLT
jgi:hypothetical protein